MRVLVRRLSSWEAGLSLLEKAGRTPSSARLLKLTSISPLRNNRISRLRVRPTPLLPQRSTSMEAQTASTVTPCSLASMARPANTGLTQVQLVDRRRWWTSRQDRKKTAARSSARPTTPATASVWTGWTAKMRPASRETWVFTQLLQNLNICMHTILNKYSDEIKALLYKLIYEHC